MTNVLGTPTPNPELEQLPAAAGIFLEEFLQSRNIALQGALRTFGKIEAARDVVSTANSCPGIIHNGSLEDARATIEDHGAIWRRETDSISHALAEQFPWQVIRNEYLRPGYFTDDRRLYRTEDNGDLWAFSSFLSQNELDSGIKMATGEMWQDLLSRLLAISPVRSERTRQGRAVVQLTLIEGIL